MNTDSIIQLPIHGGDLAALIARYGDNPPWIDFSANINPDGPPPAVLAALRRSAADLTALTQYPTGRERDMRAALADRHGYAPENVVLANGSAALIEAFLRTCEPRSCLLPQPAFSEYYRALAAAGTQIIPFPLSAREDFGINVPLLRATLRAMRPDAIILTNPHNPSGALLEGDKMRDIIVLCRTLGVSMLIDEAFIDYEPGASLLEYPERLAGHPRCLVMRSLTKFYAIPGLRIGYGIAAEPFARDLTARIPSWPVTSAAIDAALAALTDLGYAVRAREQNERRREHLTGELRRFNLRVIPSAANFLLLKVPGSATSLAEALAERFHLAVRDCSSYTFNGEESYLRIAVKTEAHHERLSAALRSLLL